MRLQRSTGLVGHWKFNEKSGITANDSSRYRNTGTLIGGPIWSDKGIKFDGVDDYVDAGNAASLNITNAITVSTWVKPKMSAGLFQHIVSKFGDTNQNGYLLQYQASDQKIYFVLRNIAVYNVGTNSAVSENWYHVVGVFDGTNLNIYLNGIKQAATTTGSIGNHSAIPLKIGMMGESNINPFNGSINEVRIYNRALSAAEIKRNYEATKHNYI